MASAWSSRIWSVCMVFSCTSPFHGLLCGRLHPESLPGQERSELVLRHALFFSAGASVIYATSGLCGLGTGTADATKI